MKTIIYVGIIIIVIYLAQFLLVILLNPNSYTCNNGKCIKPFLGWNASFPDLLTCQQNCGTVRYDCGSDKICKLTPGGKYTDSSCKNLCGKTLIPSGTYTGGKFPWQDNPQCAKSYVHQPNNCAEVYYELSDSPICKVVDDKLILSGQFIYDEWTYTEIHMTYTLADDNKTVNCTLDYTYRLSDSSYWSDVLDCNVSYNKEESSITFEGTLAYGNKGSVFSCWPGGDGGGCSKFKIVMIKDPDK